MTKVLNKMVLGGKVRALRNDFTEQLVKGSVGTIFEVLEDGTVSVDWGCGEKGWGYTDADVEAV